MATPHVTGGVVLLLQADPSLTIDQLRNILQDTALDLPPDGESPNNDYGWGRIDLYEAVSFVITPGTLAGTVTDADTGIPIEGATITIVETEAHTTTDEAGQYSMMVPAGTWTARASAYCYQPVEAVVEIVEDETMTRNFALSPLATIGSIAGKVTSKGTGEGPGVPLKGATVEILDAPIPPVTTDANGDYLFDDNVCEGTYDMRVSCPGYYPQVVRGVVVVSGETTTQNFELEEKPPILLVHDSSSQDISSWYKDALTANGYEYDYWDTGESGIPDLTTLQSYNVVIWAVPYYGVLSESMTQDNLAGYLDSGGKLFISGQDIGYYIKGSSFYTDYLHANYVKDDVNLYGLYGMEDDPIGAGLNLHISGGDGTDNQREPSEIDPVAPAVSCLKYDPKRVSSKSTTGVLESKKPTGQPQGISSSGTGGLRVDTGTYKVVYFSFGFEAIDNAKDRNATMKRVLLWLQGIPPIATISGQVKDTVTGDLIAGATISYEGPETGKVRDNDEDGDYEIKLFTGGLYTLIASVPCYEGLNPVTYTVPPDVAGADFELQPNCPIIEVSTGQFDVSLEYGANLQETLTISNVGYGALGFDIRVVPTTSAQTSVLLVAADDPSSVVAYLSEFPDLEPIDIYYAFGSTPALSTLQEYDVVMVWSSNNYSFNNPVALGDILADYIDTGGAVVAMSRCWDSRRLLKGRFITEGYTPFLSAGGLFYSWADLGSFDASSPIMIGVGAISGYA